MYGSVVNRLMEGSRYPEIVPGMGGTVCHWSDRSPVTVVEVRKGKDGKVKEITTVSDKVGPNKLTWPAQDYDITPGWEVGQDLPEEFMTWRMDGKGRLRSTYINENGRRVMSPKNGGPGLSLGSRDEYRDPHF